ncbi:histidine kinase [Nonomuraea sp. NPDC005501]|uniref:histidine kinase n=1 Tax=Nonomuraea sp. NPDC005501 TaxID=3156884 RepID=UPI0033A0F468
MLDERQRMAGEIHDTVARDLVALIGPLDAAARGRTPRRGSRDEPSAPPTGARRSSRPPPWAACPSGFAGPPVAR